MAEEKPLPDFSLRATFAPREQPAPVQAKPEASRAERKEFFRFIEAGDIAKVREVIEKFPDAPNWFCPGGLTHGKTTLITAMYGTKPEELMALLLKHGASPDNADKNGYTAMHHAVFMEKPQYIETLVRAGAAIEPDQNFLRMTPLMAAAEQGSRECADLLVICGADAAKRNSAYRCANDFAKAKNPELIAIMEAAKERRLAAEALRGEEAKKPTTGQDLKVSKPLQLKK